ncbi:protein phosphatase 2C domain-containing protein [Waterburya agarophytonicola K14]|uniref:Protein phosphatase 2C domain-containing protein n=1 Tax=Waterburya agarophytonicola KI4 TaxID=2874699 RepID=A0A964BRM8_9CYAN|nr:protein phosphatase 2C domain-containing protein [Waterburya agarophytonicola]MCC0178354.1 protein phosphatase 2C domain-containing protein [Waterburya agarophytonicola KI4]
MPHPEPRIHCSNPHCTASNSLEAHFCNRCNTPTIKRYLWSNKAIVPNEPGSTISSRYLALSPQIFLDTQPSKAPVTPEEVPPEIVAYLQLFPCYPHVPQVYGLLDNTDAWLLDYGTVPSSPSGQLKYPQQLIPKFQTLWSDAAAFQQLNWLWQMAKLWKPLSSKKVASTLLNPDLIRINGQVLQLLELEFDREYQPSLRNLGSTWKEWSQNAHFTIKDVVEQLGSFLETGKIEDIRQAIAVLDKAIANCRLVSKYSYQIYALTDSGPNRSNNEDAVYPTVDPQNIPQLEKSLAIVCDGVGGHDGGEIASGETINYLESKISQLALEELSPGKILGKLTKYINGANDIISQRNDSEQRQERERMGTTLVMALSCAHEMYLAHVGDSRIYWITPDSCHQVTTDDDLASREVRLGYAIYRDSLQYPSAGALIQAVGMRDSTALHPNLQRYMIESDCIFLLCTDGLSDFDRVEQHWQHQILPVLDGKKDLPSAVNSLIEIANQENGHDNVTVALVHCKVSSQSNIPEEIVSWSDVESALNESNLWADNNLAGSFADSLNIDDSPLEETKIPISTMPDIIGGDENLPARKQPKWLKPLILALIISTIAGVVAIFCLENIDPDPDQNKLPSVRESDTEISE